MTINPDRYLKAAFPPPLRPPDLRDEDVAHELEKSAKRSRAARKGNETRRKRAEQITQKEALECQHQKA